MSRIADSKVPKPVDASTPDTATRVLDTAERLVQSRGYNGFSYADIAEQLGITKASLHHHFETKATLGQVLIERYHAHFMQALAVIDANGRDAADKLQRYARLYAAVLEGGRLCLCGMLAAEYDTLPEAMQEGIRQFFDVNEQWLAGVLEEGRRGGRFHRRGSAREIARLLLSALEGAMLVARPYHDVARFNAAVKHLLGGLQVANPPSKSTRHPREPRQAS
jgi:TetR/AcrR family transcriptional repressor of nem operon